MAVPTRARVSEYFNYDPDTGYKVFTGPELTFEVVDSLISCDLELGLLFWKERPREMFATEGAWKIWNSRFAGKPALNADKDGYRTGAIFYRNFRAHRVVWLLAYKEWPSQEIDHIDRNRSNNSIGNLRNVSGGENRKNMPVSTANTSGVVGVSWSRGMRKWVSRIKVARKVIHLGYFSDKAEASLARAAAEAKYGFHENHGRAV